MLIAFAVFIFVELTFVIVCKRFLNLFSFKKCLFLNTIPLFVLIFMLIYFNIDKDFLKSSFTYVFYVITFYLIFWFPKLFFVLSFGTLSIPIIFFKTKILLKLRNYISLLVFLLVFIVLIYGIFIGSRTITIIQKLVTCNQLPDKFNGLKILHISDLHLGSIYCKNLFLKKIVQQSNNLKPDVIVLTGDIVNQYYEEMVGVDTILKNLYAPMGKFAVLGNHDFGDYSFWKCPKEKERNLNNIINNLNNAGFKVLRNEHVFLVQGSDSIAIVGVDNWGKKPFIPYGDIEKAYANVRHFSLVLSHDPTYWEEKILQVVPHSFTFSGHTHAFQFGFCIGNKCWSPVMFRYKNWWGLYKNNDAFLYVNRGIGTVGFIGRIGMLPEITLIKLQKSND